MAGIFRRRHPESTVLYRVLAAHFDAFLTRYETLFQRRYGYFRPVIQEVVERYLDCTNPMCGSARIRCPECGGEYLITFSCKTRYLCPSCHAKRREAWSIWLGRHLLLLVPHRQMVFTIPKISRPLFRHNRALLSDLCLCAVRAITNYMKAHADIDLMPGVVAVIQTFGNRLNFHPHLHMLVTEDSLHHKLRGHRQDHPSAGSHLNCQEAPATYPAGGTLLIPRAPEAHHRDYSARTRLSLRWP